MFRVIYLDSFNNVQHEGGFSSDKEAFEWIKQNGVCAISINVWSEYTNQFVQLYNMRVRKV